MSESKSSQKLVAKIQRYFPDINHLQGQLEEEPEIVLGRALPDSGSSVRSRAIVTSDRDHDMPQEPGIEEFEACLQHFRNRTLEYAKQGIAKIRAAGEDQPVDLTPAEQHGIEAIVLPTGRPALRIVNGLMPIKDEIPVDWQFLDDFRADIEQNLKSVGRIQMQSGPIAQMLGTGFVIGPDVIMTNRHVAVFFSAPGQDNRWVFKPEVTAGISYADDPDDETNEELQIQEVIGIHETLDLALLRIAAPTNATLPDPLSLASTRPQSIVDRDVYVLGYPARDSRATRTLMRAVFGDIFRVKRLQPGRVARTLDAEKLFDHDCSTLGGNSGSCVIDLETNQVIGLHFKGIEKEFNRAVSLWELRDDPLLSAAGLNWV